jgi:hypothetical protein
MSLREGILSFKEMLGAPNGSPGIISFSILSAITAGILYIALAANIDMYVLIGICALPFLFVIPLYPKIWLYSLIFTTPAFFYTSEEGVSALDFVLGFYYTTFIAIWLLWQLGIKKEKIVKNFADWIILFFFVALILNSVTANLNGVPFSEWGREYARYFIILLYFPIRHYVKNIDDLKQLM